MILKNIIDNLLYNFWELKIKKFHIFDWNVNMIFIMRIFIALVMSLSWVFSVVLTGLWT